MQAEQSLLKKAVPKGKDLSSCFSEFLLFGKWSFSFHAEARD